MSFNFSMSIRSTLTIRVPWTRRGARTPVTVRLPDALVDYLDQQALAAGETRADFLERIVHGGLYIHSLAAGPQTDTGGPQSGGGPLSEGLRLVVVYDD